MKAGDRASCSECCPRPTNWF